MNFTQTLLSDKELSRAADYLASTRDNLLQSVTGLSTAQWTFKISPDEWSLLEILEHVVIIESRVHLVLERMLDSPAAELSRIDSQIDELILAEVPKRSAKVQAPPHLAPSSQLSREAAITAFMESRANTLRLLHEAPSLRGHVMPHPLFGLWDGYQWILATAAHTARHTDQICEVKQHPAFRQANSFRSGKGF